MGTRARTVWKLALILIVFAVIAVGLLALTSARERPCPLAIQFIGFTNDATQGYGVFSVTNRSDISLQFRALTESKVNDSWPIYPFGTVLPHTGPYDIAAHQSRDLRATLPADAAPIRMSVACAEPWTRWESSRWKLSVWFHDHNLPRVGQFVSEGKPGHLILSSEIHK